MDQSFNTLLSRVIAIVVLGSSIWVFFDARRIGARKGLITGLGDLGPLGWSFACFFLWIVALPVYLASRGKIRRASLARSAQ